MVNNGKCVCGVFLSGHWKFCPICGTAAVEDCDTKPASTNTANDAIALWIDLLTAGKNGISFETWLRANHERVIAACRIEK